MPNDPLQPDAPPQSSLNGPQGTAPGLPIKARAEGFMADLDALEHETADDQVTIGDIEHVLAGRGFATLILILALPFVQPIPLPGLSMIFGAAIIVLGLRLALGSRSRLPRFIRERAIDSNVLRKSIAAARKIFARIERLFRRRLLVLVNPPIGNLAGIAIIVSALAMSLPLPPVILLSNSIPAFAVITLCLGIIERDGLCILIGHAMTIAAWIYFAFWWEAIKFAILHLFN